MTNNNWTRNLNKTELSAHREKQIRNIQKAIDCAIEDKPNWKDPEQWQCYLNSLEREMAQKRQLWKRGQ